MKQTARRRGGYYSYVLMFFFYYFSMSAFSAVLSVYLTGTGKTATEMSLIVSAAGVFSFAAVPLTGYLSDRVGRPRLISGCLILGVGVGALVFSQCRQVWALFLLDGLIMSFLNSIQPISERLAASCKYRYGVLRVWGTVGYAAGAQAAGLAVQYFPPIVLFSLVAVSAVLSALGFAGAEDPLPSGAPESRERGNFSSFVKNPHFLLYLMISFLCAGCSGVNTIYTPMLLTGLGVPTGAVGTVLFFGTLVEIPLILYSNRYMDRFSGKALLFASFAVFGTQFLFYGISRSSWAVVAVTVLLKSVASTLMMLIQLKIVRNLVAPRLTVTGLSVVNSVNYLGIILLQNLGGALTDRGGIQLLYLCLAAAIGLCALLTLFLKVENRETVFGGNR